MPEECSNDGHGPLGSMLVTGLTCVGPWISFQAGTITHPLTACQSSGWQGAPKTTWPAANDAPSRQDPSLPPVDREGEDKNLIIPPIIQCTEHYYLRHHLQTPAGPCGDPDPDPASVGCWLRSICVPTLPTPADTGSRPELTGAPGVATAPEKQVQCS